jgi:hypothetical protein
MFTIGPAARRAALAGEIAPQRQPAGRATARAYRRRRPEWRSRPGAIYSRAVQLDHAAVDCGLIIGIRAAECRQDHARDVFDGLAHALPGVARRIAIAQFDGFVRTCRCP